MRGGPSTRLSVWLRRFAELVVQRKWWVLAMALGATAALGTGLPRLRVEVDPDRALPQEHESIRALNEMHRLFGDKNLVVIGLFPKDGKPFTPAFLGKVDEITRRIGKIPGSVPSLLQSIASPAMKDVRAAGDGLSVLPLMETVPRTQAEADAVRERVFANPAFVGTLASADATAVAIFATFELTPALPAYGDVHHTVRDALNDADDGSFTWALSGPVVLASSLGDSSARMIFLFPVALIVIGLVHYEAFRSRQAVFLPLLTALLAVAWALGLMGLLGVPLDPYNTTTPILILAVAAGHAVQILKRYYEEFARLGDSEAAVVESVVAVGGVMLAAGGIAALSFLSLLSFGTASIRTFGVFTALGILSTLVIELTIIPALRSALPPPGAYEVARERAGHRHIDVLLERCARIANGPAARIVVAAALVLIALSALFARRIEVDTSFKREFAEGDKVRSDDDRLNRSFAGTSTLVFLVRGPGEGSIAEPAALRAIDRFERRIEALPKVGKATSVVDTLRILHRALAAPADGTAPSDLPSTHALATQYLFLYSLSGGDDLATQITPDNQIAKVTVLLHDDSTEYGKETMLRAQQILQEELPPGYTVQTTGTLASNGALTEVMVRGKLLNIAQIVVITVMVAGLLLRSALAGVLVAVPLAVALAVNFAAMATFGIPLDVVTATTSAMAVGIGADYAVYLLFRLREEASATADVDAAVRAALLSSGKAIVFVSSAIALGYSTLCLTAFKVHVQLGALVALAMVTSSLATLVVLSSLARIVARGRYREAVLGHE
jgi:predicted RND superfamily exporter protein